MRRPRTMSYAESGRTLRGRRVEEPTPQAGEVLERTTAALAQRVLGVPLDRVREDHVVGVERRAVVELDAVTQGAGVRLGVGAGLALGRERRLGIRATDLVRVQAFEDLNYYTASNLFNK